MDGRWIPRLAGLLLSLQAAVTTADDKRPVVSWEALAQVTGVTQKGRCIALVVKVQARNPVKYILDAIVVSGRPVPVHDDAGGLLYRLTDAIAVEK